MSTKRFGPTQAAGTFIEEKESDKPINAAPLGVTVLTGIFEKGRDFFRAGTKTEVQRFAGSYISESQAPNAALDFYTLSNGAGELYIRRLKDGTERNATAYLKSRTFPHQNILKIEADNWGRWAGRAQKMVKEYSSITETTLSTGVTMLKNEYKDAVLTLNDVAGKSYKVVSNDTSGVLSFASDTTLVTDLDGSADQLYSLELANVKYVGVLVKEGLRDPSEEFGMEVYLDGELVKNYDDLSMDSDSDVYVERVVNDDSSNWYVQVTDLNTGAVSAYKRPANFHGKIKTITETVLTADIHEESTSSPAGSVAELSTVTYGASVVKDTLTLTCTSAGPDAVFSVESAVQGTLPDATEDVAYAMNAYGINFTVTETSTTDFEVDDVITIEVNPFPVNGLTGFTLLPDYVNSRRVKFVIASNTATAITAVTGSDMTAVGSIGEEFLVQYPTQLGGGYDGIEDIVDATYIQAYDSTNSLINQLYGKNKGLVKLATPGVTATAVQKAGKAYAEARNYQYRAEIPSNITEDSDAEIYVNDTIGKSDYIKFHFPTYAYVSNPQGAGKILQTMSGSFLGKEALIAKNYDGYHKAAAGEDVTLSNIVDLPTGDRVLDEELLNPNGINVVKKLSGNYIMWGDRLPARDSNFKFAHARETLSHYELTFMENFNWIIFALNSLNTGLQERVISSFRVFFTKEYNKGAITGSSLNDAVLIKVDEEINTPVTAAAGDFFAQVKPRIVDTVERFGIKISKAGIFETFE